jgi:murein tripeptide amidase MpaA
MGGVDVPYIVVTSRAIESDFYMTKATEHKAGMEPIHELKKVVVLTGRVHPGESNSSFMMEGFITFITSKDPIADELRKRIVFKIIPFTNPDGVIIGNYRVSFSGHDLNRKY